MSSDTLRELLLKYPGLVRCAKDQSKMYGTIKVQNKWYRVEMISPNFPSTTDLKLTIFSGLSVSVLDSSLLNPAWSVSQILEEIPKLVQGQTDCTEIELPNVYEAQTEILGLKSPSYKIYTNSQFSSIRFTDFEYFRGHFLQLGLNSKNKYVLVDHSLPSAIQWEELFRNFNSIESYLTQFLKFLEEIRDFYTNLTDIDELCYVVQPLTPSTKDNWRIFKLKNRVFVKLVLDPFTSSPVHLNLYGPSYEVESLRSTINDGLKNWDSDMDVHANLLRTFELTYFPMADEDSENCCNICYCYQLEGHVPFISCDNRNCSLVYHAMCLKEWFTTLADGKVFLDVAFGACPFCKEKLSTSFADILNDFKQTT